MRMYGESRLKSKGLGSVAPKGKRRGTGEVTCLRIFGAPIFSIQNIEDVFTSNSNKALSVLSVARRDEFCLCKGDGNWK